MKRILALLAVAGLSLNALAADPAAAVNDLIPKLAAANVPDRYDAQMELQKLASQASKPGNDAERAALAAVLSAKAADESVPQPARVWIVRQLEYMGKAEAVETLTKLINGADAELRECARRALVKNPDLKSVETLRAALQKGGEPAWKIGLIYALGEKGDAESVKPIAAMLADAQLGGPAAKALGNIANPAAVEALWGAFDSQSVASEALVDAADRLIVQGKSAEAAAIAQKLYGQSKFSPARAAALCILAKTDAASAAKLIPEALQGSDSRLQKAGVDAAAAAFGKEASATLAALLPKLSATAKVFALRGLDASSEKAALECAADKEEPVRVAALEALGQIGSANSVAVLVKAAATGSDAEKTAAAFSLGRVNGAGAGEAIAKQAAQGDSALRVAALSAMIPRNATSALPALLQCAGESDAAISKAALTVIGKIGSDEALDGLVKLVLAAKPGAKEALQTVAHRSKNKSAVGQQLATQAQKASGQELVAILDVMALVGGDDALNAVVKFATSGSDEVKDGAIRSLCAWREFAATKPLLEIAGATGTKQVHQVLSLQAICRLVKSSDTEAAQMRVDVALGALKAAQRDQEKKQSLSALASVADRKAADAILKLLADPALKNDAAVAALNLADAIRKADGGTAKKLAEAVKKANISPELTKKAEESLNKKK